MHELAEFENTRRTSLLPSALRSGSPPISLSYRGRRLQPVGFLVYYFVPFTYRAKPNLIIKELYTADRHRSRGIGRQLMKAVAREAEEAGCGMIKWWVAKWNERGIEFYKRLGATIDSEWHEFQLSEKAFRDLAAYR
jgi:GNAT superfamily N-acetyltransferase